MRTQSKDKIGPITVIPTRSHPQSHQSPDQTLCGIVRFLPGHFDHAEQFLDTDVQTVRANFLRGLWEASFSEHLNCCVAIIVTAKE